MKLTRIFTPDEPLSKLFQYKFRLAESLNIQKSGQVAILNTGIGVFSETAHIMKSNTQPGRLNHFNIISVTPNAKRTLVLSFTEPYLYSDVVLYSKKKQPFKKWQDACQPGVSIGVVQGSSNVGLLKSKCPDSIIKEFAGGGTAVAQAVAADRVDAGINDYASAAGYMLDYTDFHILDGAPKRWPLSFATRPDETHLLRWMDNYFMLIRNDGRLDELADYWMRGPAWKKDH